MSKSLAEWADEIAENNIKLGWRGESDNRTFGDEIALIHSEVSEALEAYRNWGLADVTPLEPLPGGLPKPEGVGSELADVLIRVIDTAYWRGIDLEAEVERKIAFNKTRTFRHGGKNL